MKKTPLKVLLAILTACSGILVKPQIALAQVDMSILTEVAQSCQRDALSSKYYKKMLFNDNTLNDFGRKDIGHNTDYISLCIADRYYHSLVMSKYPWLASTGEIIPNYPGSVAVSLMSYYPRYQDSSALSIDCIVSQNPSSQECLESTIYSIFNLGYSNLKIRDYPPSDRASSAYVYICPSCVVARDDDPSGKSMVKGFIKWFLSLDKSKRREVISFLGDGEQSTIRNSMKEEANRAVNEYQETRERIRQQEINRRREEVLGN
jgi:hypothetical protein